MKFLHILMLLLITITSSCDDDGADNTPPPGSTTGGDDGGGDDGGGDDGGGGEDHINYSICNNCIWIQNDCDGNWIVGYNTEYTIGGFQFDIEGVTINSAYGGDAENSGFSLSVGNERVIGFSFSGAGIPPGSGTLCFLDITGNPISLPQENIVFSDISAESLNISSNGIINCYQNSLENTGESQLTIFNSSIANLEIGDEIGIFDSQGIINYNDCSNQIGELLVGSGVWIGEQLNLVSIGSVDLCDINGVQLSGYVTGNPLIIKIHRPKDGLFYSTEIIWETGTGYFGDIIQSINNLTLIEPN